MCSQSRGDKDERRMGKDAQQGGLPDAPQQVSTDGSDAVCPAAATERSDDFGGESLNITVHVHSFNDLVQTIWNRFHS